MAKTKTITSVRLDNVSVGITYLDSIPSAKILAAGQAIVDGVPLHQVSVRLQYADLESSVKNQCENFIKHLSRLLNVEGAAEDMETIDALS